MYQPVTRAPPASVVAEATTLNEVGTLALLAGADTVTVTVAEAAPAAPRERTAARARGGRRWIVGYLLMAGDLRMGCQRARMQRVAGAGSGSPGDDICACA